MKQTHNQMSVLTISLLGVLAFLLLSICVITLWAFASGRARLGSSSGERSLFTGTSPNPRPEALSASNSSVAVFSDIGPLRIALANTNPVVLVVTPYFPYPADDIAFREELVNKTRSIRAVMQRWLSQKTVEELVSLGEESVKESLIREINGLLILGSVKNVYFSDYLVLE